jgi:hypothetical protein
MEQTCRLLMRMLFVAACAATSTVQAVPIQITVDTSALTQGSTATLAFDFTDSAAANNTATITDFSPSAALDPTTIVIDTLDPANVSGSLSGQLTLGPGFASYLQNITIGLSISFVFDTDGLPADPASGESPDGLNFSLYETDGVTPLLGGAPLLSYGIGESAPFFVLSEFVTQGPVPTAAPEPSALALTALSLLMLVVVQSFKQ